MQGVMTFTSLTAALRAGFQVYDKYKDGKILVRINTAQGWQQAIVLPS